MINFSLMGAGRIGKMHAKFIAAHPKAKLKYIYDINSEFAEEVAKSTGCSIASSPEDAINAGDVDAVLIASATPTHTQFITCLLYTSPSPRDRQKSRMPSSA